jgi:hypothetical protein
MVGLQCKILLDAQLVTEDKTNKHFTNRQHHGMY